MMITRAVKECDQSDARIILTLREHQHACIDRNTLSHPAAGKAFARVYIVSSLVNNDDNIARIILHISRLYGFITLSKTQQL